MNHKFWLASLLCTLLSSPSFAQIEVPLDPATARFAYLPSAEGPGIPGGVPSAYELHFGMQGMLTIQEMTNDQGRITQAGFVLVGNDAAFQNNPQGRMQLEERSRQTLLTAMFDVERGPPMDRTVFRADFPGFGPDLVLEFFRQTLVRMDGGPDSAEVDGDGLRYTYPIPEPATVALLLAGCACGAGWRIARRNQRA